MIPLSPAQQSVVSGNTAAPNFLISLELDQPYYWSTRDEVTLGGNTYSPGSVQLNRIAPDEVLLRVENLDYRHTQNALSGVYLRQPVTVRWAYGAMQGPHYVRPGYWEEGYTVEPGADGEPEEISFFSGIIYGITEINEWLTIIARREPPRLYPFAKLQPPIANHIPSAGYVLQFDGQVLRIEGE